MGFSSFSWLVCDFALRPHDFCSRAIGRPPLPSRKSDERNKSTGWAKQAVLGSTNSGFYLWDCQAPANNLFLKDVIFVCPYTRVCNSKYGFPLFSSGIFWLRHMLFLGTKEYPEENSFESFLDENSGNQNAFTAVSWHTIWSPKGRIRSFSGSPSLESVPKCWALMGCQNRHPLGKGMPTSLACAQNPTKVGHLEVSAIWICRGFGRYEL